jgi:hypothetical protein
MTLHTPRLCRHRWCRWWHLPLYKLRQSRAKQPLLRVGETGPPSRRELQHLSTVRYRTRPRLRGMEMGTNLLRPPRPLRLIHKGRMKETAGWCRPLTAGTQTVHEFLLKRLADESSTQEDVSDHQAVAVRFDAHKLRCVRANCTTLLFNPFSGASALIRRSIAAPRFRGSRALTSEMHEHY